MSRVRVCVCVRVCVRVLNTVVPFKEELRQQLWDEGEMVKTDAGYKGDAAFICNTYNDQNDTEKKKRKGKFRITGTTGDGQPPI